MKSVLYDGDGSVSEWKEYEYYADGKLMKYECYDSDGNLQEWQERDANGNTTKYNDGYENVSAEYDANGNITKFVRYNDDGSIASWLEYINTYYD